MNNWEKGKQILREALSMHKEKSSLGYIKEIFKKS